MTSGSTIISCTLAALAGVCFVTGISLLSNEGSGLDYGPRKEINRNA